MKELTIGQLFHDYQEWNLRLDGFKINSFGRYFLKALKEKKNESGKWEKLRNKEGMFYRGLVIKG